MAIRPAKEEDRLLHPKCDYVAHYRHDSEKFDFGVILPKKVKDAHFLQDTIDNHYRKIVWYDNALFLTGIYFRNSDSTAPTLQSLTLSTGSLTTEQQQLALNILKSGRPKK